ncbi:MAG: hypothetical protein ACI81V_000119 [Lentimonas sp.]|jgi:hypothetical protein
MPVFSSTRRKLALLQRALLLRYQLADSNDSAAQDPAEDSAESEVSILRGPNVLKGTRPKSLCEFPTGVVFDIADFEYGRPDSQALAHGKIGFCEAEVSVEVVATIKWRSSCFIGEALHHREVG